MAEDIRVVAFVYAKPGQEDAVRDVLLACVPPTRAEPGNKMYALNRDAKNASIFVLVEHWESQQALDTHFQTPHFKTVIQAMEGLVAKAPEMHVMQPV